MKADELQQVRPGFHHAALGSQAVFRTALSAVGVTLSAEQTDLLLDSVTGDDVVKLAAAYQAARAVDAQLHRPALALSQHLLVQGPVARTRRQVGQRQVAMGGRGQDAGGQQAQAHVGRHALTAGPGGDQVGFQPRQAITGGRLRLHIDLYIELRQFGHHLGRVQPGQKLAVLRGRPATGIDQPGLCFQTDHRTAV